MSKLLSTMPPKDLSPVLLKGRTQTSQNLLQNSLLKAFYDQNFPFFWLSFQIRNCKTNPVNLLFFCLFLAFNMDFLDC